MSEKEKAKKLVEKFSGMSFDDGIGLLDKMIAKQCAKIVCDVILNDVMEYWERSNIYAKAAKIYWQNVLKEIELL